MAAKSEDVFRDMHWVQCGDSVEERVLFSTWVLVQPRCSGEKKPGMFLANDAPGNVGWGQCGPLRHPRSPTRTYIA
jgi:hypothetical protein